MQQIESVALTDNSIQSLRSEFAEIYWDALTPSLGVRIYKNGARFFVARYGSDTEQIAMVGSCASVSLDDARRLAKQVAAYTVQPAIQLPTAISKTPTLRQAWQDFQRVKNIKSTTARNYALRIEKNLEEWLDLSLHEITRPMVLIRFKEISERGASMGNYTMRTLRCIIFFAMGFYEDADGNPLVKTNPVSKLSQLRVWNPEHCRRRTIQHGIKQWFRAVQSLNSATSRDLFLLYLFTGMRKNEALSLTWEQVDLKAGTIELWKTKNGDDRLIPLSDYAWRMLMLRHHFSKGNETYVFQTRTGNHLKEPQCVVNEIIRRSGVPFSVHDLRRTFATIGDDVELKSEVVKALLGHRGDVTEDYTVRSIERLRRATQKITNAILVAAEVQR